MKVKKEDEKGDNIKDKKISKDCNYSGYFCKYNQKRPKTIM